MREKIAEITRKVENKLRESKIGAKVKHEIESEVGIGIGYQVSSIGYLRLFSVKVSGIGYPIPNFEVSGIVIRYRKVDLRYRLGIRYLNRYLLNNSDCFEAKYLVIEITFLKRYLTF